MSWCFNDSKHPTYLYDKRLPFGARASPTVFHRLTQAICRMMARRGYTVLAYPDDFLVIEPTQIQCKAAFDTLLTLLESLGFTVNWTKVAYPAQCLIFLGVEIDTVLCELRLSEDRVPELLSLLKGTSSKRKCTKLHLQRLLGKLNWAARVVRGGRTILRRLITLANSVKRPYHRVYLNLDARADLMWWTCLQCQHTTVQLCSHQPSQNSLQQCLLMPPCLVGGAYGKQTGCMSTGPWITLISMLSPYQLQGDIYNCLSCQPLGTLLVRSSNSCQDRQPGGYGHSKQRHNLLPSDHGLDSFSVLA